MNILVTGSEGSLMRAVIPRLIKHGHRVVGMDKIVIDQWKMLATAHLGYSYNRIDLTDRHSLESYTSDIDVVIHAAATIYGVKGFNEHSNQILGDDVTMTSNILRWSKARNVSRFIFMSSSMVYEKMKHDVEGVKENLDLLTPDSGYGLSKYIGEKMVRDSGIPYIIWRPFNIITPYEKAHDEQGMSHVFADLIKAIVIDKVERVPIFNTGLQTRCFTWINDVADAIANYSLLPSVPSQPKFMTNYVTNYDYKEEKVYFLNQAYNIGTTEEVTIRKLARIIHERARLMGFDVRPNLTFTSVPLYRVDVQKRKPNIDLIFSTFGWSPTLSLAGSIDECLRVLK